MWGVLPRACRVGKTADGLGSETGRTIHRYGAPTSTYKAKGLLRVIDGDQGPEKNAAAFKAAM